MLASGPGARVLVVGVLPKLVLMVALGAAPICAAAADEPPVEMAPHSQWVADYDADSCALRRAFRGGDHEAILELRGFSPGNGFKVTIVSDTLAVTRESPRVRFEPDDEWHEPLSPMFVEAGSRRGIYYNDSLLTNATSADDPPPVAITDADRDARERAITGLSVNDGFDRDILLKTGSMHAPMGAMRACMDDLITHWGLDVAAQRTLSRRVQPIEMARWARRIQEHYPPEMVRTGQGASIQTRLIVGSDGKPTSCHVQVHISHPSFEEAACDLLMRHARFEPALDASGAPVASFYTTTLVYQVF